MDVRYIVKVYLGTSTGSIIEKLDQQNFKTKAEAVNFGRSTKQRHELHGNKYTQIWIAKGYLFPPMEGKKNRQIMKVEKDTRVFG